MLCKEYSSILTFQTFHVFDDDVVIYWPWIQFAMLRKIQDTTLFRYFCLGFWNVTHFRVLKNIDVSSDKTDCKWTFFERVFFSLSSIFFRWWMVFVTCIFHVNSGINWPELRLQFQGCFIVFLLAWKGHTRSLRRKSLRDGHQLRTQQTNTAWLPD